MRENTPGPPVFVPPLPPGPPPPHFPPLPLGAPPPLPPSLSPSEPSPATSQRNRDDRRDDRRAAAQPPAAHAWPHERIYAAERTGTSLGVDGAWGSPARARRASTQDGDKWPQRGAQSARTPLDSLEEVLLHHVVALRKGELLLSGSAEGQRTAHSTLALCEQLAVLIRSQLYPQHTEMGPGTPGWGKYSDYPLSMQLASSLQHILADSEPYATPHQSPPAASDLSGRAAWD
jgi:hypothetical protein